MSGRVVRLVVVPAVLFAAVSAAVYALAEWHPAKPDAATSPPVAGRADAMRGGRLFAENCATCHGPGGRGGGVGPTLAGSDVTIEQARSTIENGSGIMPPALVTGPDLEDVLAYLRAILAS